MEDLSGRIEAVSLVKSIGGRSCIGELVGDMQKVMVSNSAQYIGKIVLSRFDLKRKGRGLWLGNFISSNVIPEGLAGLAPEKYILYALWEPRMTSTDIPTIDEINEYFEPGDLTTAFYFTESSNAFNGRYRMVPGNSAKPIRISYKRVCDDMSFNPQKGSKLIVLEEHYQIPRIELAARESGRVPIRVEAYR